MANRICPWYNGIARECKRSDATRLECERCGDIDGTIMKPLSSIEAAINDMPFDDFIKLMVGLSNKYNCGQ